MDLPLRSKLLAAFMSAVVLCGILTILAGSFLINRMVISEAQRRIALALKTANSMLELRLRAAENTCDMIAAAGRSPEETFDRKTLRKILENSRYDFLHILDIDGYVAATARGGADGTYEGSDPIVRAALANGRVVSGITLVPIAALRDEGEEVAERAMVPVIATPHAKPGSPSELTDAMVIEAAAPIIGSDGKTAGVVRVGTMLNRNFGFVDFVRENIFTADTYAGKNLGTVTIFQGDVRITTNVIGPGNIRAVGTRVSEEVRDQVLEAGRTWTGPAFVVDSWYISAYKPLRDIGNRIVGMLYVGVLKNRYDDMRNQALGLFIVVVLVTLAGVVFLSVWLARRLSRPLTRLTDATAEVARGNLSYQLPDPHSAERDEIYRLTRAFNRMVSALSERDQALKTSRDDLQKTADQLKKSVTHYLETLEFITHELKNQIAAMKINLLAVRDGYVGPVGEDQKEALDDVNNAINRAEEMILNYLNLSRIERGELLVRPRQLHVESDVIRPVLTNLKGRLESRGMRVELEVAEDLFVSADPSLLQIVYENLLSNAVKYGRPGGLIRLSGAKAGDMAEFHVWNDGPGVPADQTGRLFERFFRIPHGATGERGTGLGLFITREILRRQGGDITVSGSRDEWIDFMFRLPLSAAAGESMTEAEDDGNI